ncbi:MAG: cell division protein FtsA [Anaerolineae bacterium]
MGHVVTAIDIGSSNIRTLVGEVTDTDVIRVVGIGVVPSRGVSYGVITDLEEATLAIGESIQKAERIVDHSITRVYVAMGGTQISSQNTRGSVVIGRGDRPIDREDLARVLDAAQVIALPHNRQVIQCTAREYVLDSGQRTKNPLGLLSCTLDVDAHIITGDTPSISNLANCFKRNHVEIIEYIPQPVASAEAVLSGEEMNDGVAVVDMGGDTTSVIIYAEGSPFDTHVYPVGGKHFTKEIVRGLHTPESTAEEIKVRYGQVLSSKINPAEMIKMSTFGSNLLSTIPRRRLAEIISVQMEDILNQYILPDIKRSGYDGLLAAGIVLTGGVAQTADAADLISSMLQLPVRIGLPRRLHGLTVTLENPTYSTAVGLLLYAMKRETTDKPLPTVEQRTKNWSARILHWLKNLLPR